MTAGCFALGTIPRAAACDVAAAASVALVATGIRFRRPERREGWLLLLTGLASWVTGQLIGSASVFAGHPAPLGGVPGGFYIAGYPLLAAGLLKLGSGASRGRTLRQLLDVGVVLFGLVIALWLPAFNPVVDGHGHRGLEWALTVFYPVGDLLLVALALRIVLAGARGPSALVLPLGFGWLLAGDLVHGASDRLAAAGDIAWTVGYVVVGLAAVVPSMRAVRPSLDDNRRAGTAHWVLYAVGLALLPLTFLGEWLTMARIEDALLYVAVGLMLTAVVVTRLALLFRDLERALGDAETSERKFRMIFEHSPIGISLGRNGIMSETNPALQKMLGYTGEEFAGLHYLEITHPDDRALEPQLEFDRGARTAFAIDKRYLTKTGETVDTRVHVSTGLVDGLGMSLIEDVRERRRLEEELRQAQKLEAVGQLAGGVAHDFNNLMTAVGGYADLLLRELEEPSQVRKVSAIRDSAARAADLTRQLLAFSRRQVLQVRELDLCDVVADAERILQPVLGDAVRLETALARAPVPVRVDPAQMERVLLNLAANAHEAMGDGGVLTLGVGREGDEAVLTVADTGAGMSETVRGQIFEPFFTTKSLSEASGLGLATVHGIVHQSGGSIDVESKVGRGTCFTIRLPLAELAV
jgi:PAS domain S-box-containing protein